MHSEKPNTSQQNSLKKDFSISKFNRRMVDNFIYLLQLLQQLAQLCDIQDRPYKLHYTLIRSKCLLKM